MSFTVGPFYNDWRKENFDSLINRYQDKFIRIKTYLTIYQAFDFSSFGG